MNWKIALLVALITAVVTVSVTAFVADEVTGMLGVSDFEGKRGFALVFLFIPAGLAGGFLLGLLGTTRVGAVAWAQFGKALGLSVALGQAALFATAGLSPLGRPQPPLIGGQALDLEVELHIPAAWATERARRPDGIRLSLFAGDKDNSYAVIDTAHFQEEGGTLVATTVAGLNSSAHLRILSLGIEENPGLAWERWPCTTRAVPRTAASGYWACKRPCTCAQGNVHSSRPAWGCAGTRGCWAKTGRGAASTTAFASIPGFPPGRPGQAAGKPGRMRVSAFPSR